MKIYSIDGIKPKIDPEVSFLSENIIIIGDVEIGKGSVIFDNVVLEGNHAKIRIGNYTNIQSGTMVHGLVDSPTIIGDYNTIGHRCIIHGCKTEENVTIGMGSIIMGYSFIGRDSLVGAGSLVTERKKFEPRSFILGHPAKKIRDLTDKEIQYNKGIAQKYSEIGKHIKTNLKDISSEYKDFLNSS